MAASEIIGLIPAGGQATRISPLPLSKELYPIGFQTHPQTNRVYPQVVSQYLLERMRDGGVKNVYFILRPGKWDIPTYFGDGSCLDLHIGYLIMGLPYGVPFTLDQAFSFVADKIVALGFPDILFTPKDAFVRIIQRQQRTQADVVLGLFPTDKPQKAGMVDFDSAGWVQAIIEKPPSSSLRYMWGIAVWTPKFTQFLHDYLLQLITHPNFCKQREVPIGDVIQAGIHAGLKVQAEAFADGSYLDIGTPDDLIQVLVNFFECVAVIIAGITSCHLSS